MLTHGRPTRARGRPSRSVVRGLALSALMSAAAAVALVLALPRDFRPAPAIAPPGGVQALQAVTPPRQPKPAPAPARPAAPGPGDGSDPGVSDVRARLE